MSAGIELNGANIVADIDAGASPELIGATARFLYDMRAAMPMFVVYDHPADFPDHYVARMWLTVPTEKIGYVLRSTTLDRLRDMLEMIGLAHLHRMPDDDPRILETWI